MREQELNEYWKTVVDTIQDGIMIVDKAGTIVSVNKAFETISGYSSDEIIGRPCSILNCSICETVRDHKDEVWCNLFKEGSLNLRRCVVMRKDGQNVPVLKNASLLHDPFGKVIGAAETLTNISEIVEKENQLAALKKELISEDSFHGLIGSSSPMKKVYDLISNVAHSDAPVIIYGESGTGKELVSRAIHTIGDRRDNPFVKVNCAALTESLLESELFGHVKGAYTGAFQDRKGRFEIANGGVIFLDEIGDLPLSTQVKLLRVLEEHVIERVGDNQLIPIDVRVISATNKNLTELVEAGRFREDLYFRINVIPIRLPPLRERTEDIPLLADSFFRRLRMKTGKKIDGISNSAMEAMLSYSWPGNVREVKNVFEYAFVTCQESVIQPYHLPPDIFQMNKPLRPRKRSAQKRGEAMKTALIDALEKTGGNQSKAAKILGVSRVTVWNRMKRYGVDSKKVVTVPNSMP